MRLCASVTFLQATVFCLLFVITVLVICFFLIMLDPINMCVICKQNIKSGYSNTGITKVRVEKGN